MFPLCQQRGWNSYGFHLLFVCDVEVSFALEYLGMLFTEVFETVYENKWILFKWNGQICTAKWLKCRVNGYLT